MGDQKAGQDTDHVEGNADGFEGEIVFRLDPAQTIREHVDSLAQGLLRWIESESAGDAMGQHDFAPLNPIEESALGDLGVG